MRTLAERLVAVREEKGWRKADLMRAAGLKSPSTLTELENGKRRESPQLPAIAAALGVNALWLQHGKGPKDPNIPSAPATAPFTKDEQLLLRGFRVADAVTQRHMLMLAQDAHENFPGRNLENHRQ